MARLTERSYRALAIRQNGFGPDPEGDDALSVATREFTELAHRQQEQYLRDRRKRLVEAVNAVGEFPRLFWNHRYFRHVPGFVGDTREAVDMVKRELARSKSSTISGRRPHAWKRADLEEALVFARYMRRFSARLWMREAA